MFWLAAHAEEDLKLLARATRCTGWKQQQECVNICDLGLLLAKSIFLTNGR